MEHQGHKTHRGMYEYDCGKSCHSLPSAVEKKKKISVNKQNQLLTRSLDSDSHLEPFLSFTFSHCLLWFSHTVWFRFRFKHQNCLVKKKADGLGVNMSKKKQNKKQCVNVSQ